MDRLDYPDYPFSHPKRLGAFPIRTRPRNAQCLFHRECSHTSYVQFYTVSVMVQRQPHIMIRALCACTVQSIASAIAIVGTMVSATYCVCSSSKDMFMLELRRELGHFQSLDSFEKSSYVLGSEAWEEYSSGLLSLIKDFVLSVWEERKRFGYNMVNTLTFTSLIL